MYRKPKELIQKEWMRWVFAGGKRLPGLVKRRQWECNRFFE
jgi:lysozyme